MNEFLYTSYRGDLVQALCSDFGLMVVGLTVRRHKDAI